MYDRETTVWGSANGTERLVKDLSDRHVVNILNWLLAENSRRYDLIEFFEEEYKLRRLWAFAANKPVPTKLEDGTYGFTNITWWGKLKHKAILLKYNWIANRKKKQLNQQLSKSLKSKGK